MPEPSLVDRVVGGVSAGLVPVLAWFLGRGAQSAKLKLEARGVDQTDIKRLAERVEKLEGSVERLMTEKFTLEQSVIGLKTEIGTMTVQLAEYKSRDVMATAQIASLETRLAAKEEELRCAQHALKEMEQKK